MDILHLGDCLEVLKTMEKDSVDSIICDPPYGFGFMGKKWDYDVPSIDIWIAALRVLKPGGHLLSFGGPRTYHRLACAIEDAGFEIRDQIMWVFGSGFPKSLNISKAIDKQMGLERERIERTTGSNNTESRGDYGLGEVISNEAISDDAKKWNGWGSTLKPAFEPLVLAQKPLKNIEYLASLVHECQSLLFALIVNKISLSSLSEKTQLYIAQWRAGKNTLLLDVLFEVMGTLQSESVRNSNLNTELSWLTILGEILELENMYIIGMELSLTTDLKILKSLLSKITQENMHQKNGLGELSNVSLVQSLFNALATKLDYILTPSVQENATKEADPLNLRPDAEPIVLARKPCSEKTVAANVIKHGCGGINIDASRIGSGGHHGGKTAAGKSSTYFDQKDYVREPHKIYTQGRFPANLILDEEAGAMLDEQSGMLKSGAIKKNQYKDGIKNEIYGKFGGFELKQDLMATSGGASRFFYCPKTSKNERGEDNKHPTVKPLKLMEYLIRLITPKGGTILDPFMGSGSTGLAAKNLGFEFVGIEKEAEYFEIAKRRLERLI